MNMRRIRVSHLGVLPGFLKRFCNQQTAQDLIEYTLLLSFVVTVAVAIMTTTSIGEVTVGVWSQAASYLSLAAN